MKICVVGLGYIGLPTALLLAEAGNTVVGVDINTKIITTLSGGELPFNELGLSELFQRTKHRFTATSSVESSEVYIIAVPTPLKNGIKLADLSAVKSAAESIAKVIKEEQLVILESTVPPGTSEQLIIPILNTYMKKYLPGVLV